MPTLGSGDRSAGAASASDRGRGRTRPGRLSCATVDRSTAVRDLRCLELDLLIITAVVRDERVHPSLDFGSNCPNRRLRRIWARRHPGMGDGRSVPTTGWFTRRSRRAIVAALESGAEQLGGFRTVLVAVASLLAQRPCPPPRGTAAGPPGAVAHRRGRGRLELRKAARARRGPRPRGLGSGGPAPAGPPPFGGCRHFPVRSPPRRVRPRRRHAGRPLVRAAAAGAQRRGRTAAQGPTETLCAAARPPSTSRTAWLTEEFRFAGSSCLPGSCRTSGSRPIRGSTTSGGRSRRRARRRCASSGPALRGRRRGPPRAPTAGIRCRSVLVRR